MIIASLRENSPSVIDDGRIQIEMYLRLLCKLPRYSTKQHIVGVDKVLRV